MKPVLLLALLALGGSANAFTPYEPLRFNQTADELARDCADARKRAETALREVSTLPWKVRTFDNTVWAIDRAIYDLLDETATDTFMAQVSPDAAVRDAAGRCDAAVGRFAPEVYGRADLARAVRQYAALKVPLKPEAARLLEKTLLDFRRAGAELPDDKRDALADARAAVTRLENEYLRNLDDSRDFGLFTKDELAGLPPAFTATLAREGGHYRVGLDEATFGKFMDEARDAQSRRRLQVKYDERGARSNPSVLRDLLDARRRAARLLGYPSHAAFVAETATVREPGTVDSFLSRLRAKLLPVGRRELDALIRLKRAHEGGADEGRLRAWDWRYYDRLTRQELDDERRLRDFLRAGPAVERMLALFQRVLGLRFREVPDALRWHRDARLLEIADASGGPPLGYLYLDLYAHEGKASRIAAFNLVSGRKRLDGPLQLPVAALLASFEEEQAPLSHDDLATLFHEFGHAFHEALSRSAYGRFSPPSVARDFVEVPAEVFENWAWDQSVLDELSGKKVPAQWLERRRASRDANAALKALRQLQYARVDQEYHSAAPPADPGRTYAREAADTALIPVVEGTHPEAAFTHLATGYDAAYYSYLWAKVRADDLYAVLTARGALDPMAGRRFREEILERGSSRDERTSMSAFLGRESNDDAYLRALSAAKPR